MAYSTRPGVSTASFSLDLRKCISAQETSQQHPQHIDYLNSQHQDQQQPQIFDGYKPIFPKAISDNSMQLPLVGGMSDSPGLGRACMARIDVLSSPKSSSRDSVAPPI